MIIIDNLHEVEIMTLYRQHSAVSSQQYIYILMDISI